MRIPSTVNYVLFDLDGTLVDHDHAARLGVLSFASQLGVTGEPDELVKRWAEIERHWFAEFEKGRATITGQRVERTRSFLGRPELTEADALATYDIYLAAYREHWRAYDDAAAALEAARVRGTVGIFTNGGIDMQTGKLQVSGLYSDDLIMLCAPELGAAKPQPAVYEAVLDVLGVNADRAHEVAVIGDSFPNDVAGARAAGMVAIHLDRHGASGDVSSLREIEF